jgi:hypothetical protein
LPNVSISRNQGLRGADIDRVIVGQEQLHHGDAKL